MPFVFEQCVTWYFKLRTKSVAFWMTHQRETQEAVFIDLMKQGRKTSFGKDHSFSSKMTVQEFQEKVPVRGYEEFSPYIERIVNGEQKVSWPSEIRYCSKSSGTTAVSKYLPVSHEGIHQNNYRAGRDLYTLYFMNKPHSRLFRNMGSVLGISGRFQEQKGRIQIGDVSAIIASQLPSLLRSLRYPSLSITSLPSWEEKIPKILEEATTKNITHLSGVPTWFVPLFEALRKKHSFTNLREVWPQLELFVHGAVSFEPYRSLFKQLIPHDDMNYLEVYNASEGFFGIQDDLTLKGEMVLLTNHGVFYEFIPFSEYQKGSRAALTLKDIEIGIDYALIITTNSGLWRYDLGDCVQFTNTSPYRIKITGRTKAFINLAGEELMVGNTDEAVAHVSREMNTIVRHYTVAPVYMNKEGKVGHEWIIECESPVSDISGFVQKLDTVLKQINSDYQAKREGDIALQLPVIHFVKEGTVMKWLAKKGKLGGQHKVPKLSQNRDILEEILEIE